MKPKDVMNMMHGIGLIGAGALLAIGIPPFASKMDARIESEFTASHGYSTDFVNTVVIEGETTNGIAALTRHVNEANREYLAQETMAALPAVRGVDNPLALDVTLESAEESDIRIQGEVLGILASRRSPRGARAEVRVRDGVVTLSGLATNETEKRSITALAADVVGVKRVVNEMTFARGLSPGSENLGVVGNLRVVNTPSR